MSAIRTTIGAYVRKVGSAVARVAFPPACAGCGELVGETGSLCAGCWSRLRFLERPWCAVLGTPFAYEVGDDAVSPEAIANPPAFRRARAAVAYSGVARQMVQGLKYRDRLDAAPWMAGWMARAGAELIADADMVVAVPLHRARFLWRRYNQSAELARALSGRTGLSFETAAVVRSRATRQQVGLGLKERQGNVRGAFKVPEAGRRRIEGRSILLVDDVYTTGATVSAASRALMRAGAGAVDVLTFARVVPGDFLGTDAGPI